jgi:hypothetical protein
MNRYRSLAFAVVAAVLVAGQSYLPDGLTSAEKVQIAVAAVSAFLVWLAPNVDVPYWSQIKATAQGVMAVLAGLAGYLAAGQTMAGALWVNLALMGLAAAGIVVLPNAPETRVPPSQMLDAA